MVRAKDGKIEVPGSSLASDIFCFFLSSANAEDAKKTPHLRKTESFFGQKSSAFCVKVTT